MKASALFSTIHAIGAVYISLSVLFGSLSRRILLGWSTSYFIIDTIWEISRRRAIFVFHHIMCLICLFWASKTNLEQGGNLMPKMLLTEFSTPFLHLAQATKRYQDKVLFKRIFFLCRIIYIPMMALECSIDYPEIGMDKFTMVAIFWMMNVAWYCKQK